MAVLQALLTAVLLATTSSAFKLWEAPGDIPSSVPNRCRTVLVQNITCDTDYLVQPHKAATGEVLVGQAAAVYCGTTCSASLQSFRTAVINGCGTTPYKLFHNSSELYTGKAIVDGLVWAHKLVCTRDSDGYCLADMYAGNKDACSDCYLKYGATMQEMDFGRGKLPEDAFKELLSTCSVNPTKYPYTYTSIPPTTTGGGVSSSTSAPPSAPSCAGTKYTSKEGDTCESISLAQSVSTDRLVDVNNLDYKCDTLVAGMSLCIQDKCKLATIKEGQTCEDVVGETGVTVVQLTSWNPTLRSACDSRLTPNLDALAGRHVCIEAPGQYDFPTDSSSSPQPTWTLTSPLFSSWTTGNVVTSPTEGIVNATTNFDPDFALPSETSNFDKGQLDKEIEWLRYCWITEEDHGHGYDPYAQPAACQNLYWKHCVYDPAVASPTSLARAPAVCTPDRSGYGGETDPDPVTTPQPVQSGITQGCNKFYKVVRGDGCASVISSQKVSSADFYKWNPSVGSDCRNLQIDTWVCVGFDERLVFPTQTAAPRIEPRWF